MKLLVSSSVLYSEISVLSTLIFIFPKFLIKRRGRRRPHKLRLVPFCYPQNFTCFVARPLPNTTHFVLPCVGNPVYPSLNLIPNSALQEVFHHFLPVSPFVPLIANTFSLKLKVSAFFSLSRLKARSISSSHSVSKGLPAASHR